MKTRLMIVLSMAVLAISPASALEVWDGPSIPFVRVDGADGTDPANQDHITPNVVLARSTYGGSIENVVFDDLSDNFTLCIGGIPTDTEWAIGDIADYAILNYGPFLSGAFGNCDPSSVVGLSGVLHLISEDIYIPITFLSWARGERDPITHEPLAHGGFSYIRGTRQSVDADASMWGSIKAMYR